MSKSTKSYGRLASAPPRSSWPMKSAMPVPQIAIRPGTRWTRGCRVWMTCWSSVSWLILLIPTRLFMPRPCGCRCRWSIAVDVPDMSASITSTVWSRPISNAAASSVVVRPCPSFVPTQETT
ncbi:MAG: hypothetical protein E6J41_24555 [Chloroflexi bacterium]|nr:MAG: hypothetical protein E6J41_24555 [Chloroflexota bacterium]